MQTPDWAEKIADSFGKIGETPKFRVIFSDERKNFCFGVLRKSYPHIHARWVIERLIPWQEFGKWDYEAFGPKPQDGEYVHVFTIQMANGQVGAKGTKTDYISLEDFGADTLRMTMKVIELGRALPWWTEKKARLQMLEEEEEQWRKRFSDWFDNETGIGLVGGPLGENAISGIPGKKKSDDVVITNVNDLPPRLREKLRCKPGQFKQMS